MFYYEKCPNDSQELMNDSLGDVLNIEKFGKTAIA